MQSDQSLQGTLWVTKNPKRLQADSEGSDQPARIRSDLSSLGAHANLKEMLCPGSFKNILR